MAQLNIFFIPPVMAPVNGFRLRYRIKGSGLPYTTHPVNPTASPVVVTGLPANTDYEGTLESDCGNGLYSLITNFSSTTCFCASGYLESPDHTFCYRFEEVEATPPTGGIPENTVKVSFASYSQFGSYIYHPGFNINGTGPSDQINNTNAFWINGATSNTTKGPLNRSGVWSDTNVNNQDVGFAICLSLTQSKVYYIGIAGDNRNIIRIDGNVIVSQDVAALGLQYAGSMAEQQIPFKVWHIYPVAISAGPHVIEVIGHNDSGEASMGAEIYDATAAELIAATSYADLDTKLIFSSKDYIGQPVEIGTAAVGYSCPPGYALKSCQEPPVCVRRLTKACGDFSA